MMRLTCKECGEVFKSLIIDKQSALQEVSRNIGQHIESKHKEVASSVARQIGDVLALAHNRLMYLKFVKELDTISQEDERDSRQMFIFDNYNNQEDQLVSILQLPLYEPEEEEEEETKEETKEQV